MTSMFPLDSQLINQLISLEQHKVLFNESSSPTNDDEREIVKCFLLTFAYFIKCLKDI